MKHYSEKEVSPDESHLSLWRRTAQQGQTLVEYALILVLVGISFGIGLQMTQPAISTAFQNTIYGLLGQESEFREYDNPGDFWMTVTWVAENPPEQRRIPTRTLAPPTSTRVGGEEDDDDPGNPGGNPGNGNQPLPTITPVPTSTPVDITHVAPWHDKVENPSWYRLGSPPYLGSADWHGLYYPNRSFGSTPIEYYNRALYGAVAHGVLKFPSQNYATWRTEAGSPLPLSEEFSARLTRDIYLPTTMPLQFYIKASGGVRMWLIPRNLDDTYPTVETCTSNCIQIFNDWTDGITEDSHLLNINSGFYRLYVEYYNAVGTPKILDLDILTVRNPDDASFIGNIGDNNLSGSTAQCNWGRVSTTDSNSLMYLWDQKGGLNTVCYLELRGYVNVPNTIAQPQFVFWDVWDIGAQQAAWFEIGVYTPIDSENRYSLNREAIQWHRVNVHSANTLNYNWTRHIYDFDTLQTLTGQDFRGQNVTFRFAFANGNDNRIRWHVDDIQIIDGALGTYGQDIGFDQTFDLNDADQRNYFITSGQWDLTSNNTAPAQNGESTGCCSWELRPNGTYTKFSASPTWPDVYNNPPNNNMRVHYVELIPMIDVSTSPTVDQDGDEGTPMLSFWHGYHVGSHTKLEVQYRPEGGSEWLVIPDPESGPPIGRFVELTNWNVLNQRQMRPVDISLEGITATRFQIRFAMTVHGSNTQQYEGWWIDNIKLHREDAPRFLDYPFFDDAENGVVNWLTGGEWWITNEKSYSGNNSFTDTPNGQYSNLNGQYLMTIYPIDLRNNTPDNLGSPERPGNTDGAAVDPYLTFWHQRDFGYTDTGIAVEWKRNSESDTSWRKLWVYRSNGSYNNATSNVETRNNLTWEYVSISLEPVLAAIGTPSDLEADDIVIRFLLTGTYGSSDGVYIDDIRLGENENVQAHNLWASGTTPTVGSVSLGAGDGLIYTASPDDPDWESKWRLGGEWDRVTWESHNGLSSFHSSPAGQESAPTDSISGYTRSPVDTFNVLELTDIIDLRGTPRSIMPTLYFWSRYDFVNTDRLRVQVSFELEPGDYTQSNMLNHMTSSSRCGSGNPQCYEHEWGWSRWLDVPNNSSSGSGSCHSSINPCSSWNNTLSSNRRNLGWHLHQVDLSYIRNSIPGTHVSLAQNGSNIGRRIRIRFVADIGKHSQPSDGWYVTDVSIEPRRVETIATIADGPFVDNAENMYNWFGEGDWGIDPSSGLITVLGVWDESWWDARYCTSNGGTAQCITNQFNTYPYPNWPQTGSTSSQSNRFYTGPHRRTISVIDYPSLPISGFFTPHNVTHTAGARFVLETPPVGTSGVEAGDYYFVVTTDDGLRMRWEEIDMAGNVIQSPPMSNADLPSNIVNEWNIFGSRTVNQYGSHGQSTSPFRSWIGQGSTTYTSDPVTFEYGKRYRLIMEYFDSGGNARLALNVHRSSTLSFSDTPKISPDPSAPDVPPLNRANTSLRTVGTIDLRNTLNPQILYQVAGRTCNSNGNTTLLVEYSDNGGFTWTEIRSITGLNTSLGMTTGYQNGLPSGQQIMLRFRLNRLGTDTAQCSGRTMGVWISQIVIVDAG